MIKFWCAQGIGVIICVLAVWGYFRKTKDKFLGVQVIINILYCVEYALLGVWSGAVSNVISTAKFLSFERDAKAGRKTSYKKSVFFSALGVIFGILVFDGWLSLVPIFVAVMITFATAQDDPIVTRLAFALANALWVVFNFVGRAYVSAAYSAIELAVSVATAVMFIKIRAKEKEDAKTPENAEMQ